MKKKMILVFFLVLLLGTTLKAQQVIAKFYTDSAIVFRDKKAVTPVEYKPCTFIVDTKEGIVTIMGNNQRKTFKVKGAKVDDNKVTLSVEGGDRGFFMSIRVNPNVVLLYKDELLLVFRIYKADVKDNDINTLNY